MPRLAKEVTEFEFQRSRRFKDVGVHGVGKGLFVQVTEGGSRTWLYRFRMDGKARNMGLGPVDKDNGLEHARAEVKEAKTLIKAGVDPIDARMATRARGRKAREDRRTFAQVAQEFIAEHEAGWTKKHADQWRNTLRDYVIKKIGGVPVHMVDAEHVLTCLRPIWTTKTETASRVRSRIELVINFAMLPAKKYRPPGPNPAALAGLGLPSRKRIQTVVHHPAMDYRDVPAFMVELRKQNGMAARALEFAILTSCRTTEVLGAPWSEIDEQAGAWLIPAARMKAGREHRVPLAGAATALLASIKPDPLEDPAALIFPGPKGQLSNMAMAELLKRMGVTGVTVHGFRSSFRTWASDHSTLPGDLAELALAHAVGDKVRQAYDRGDGFARRRQLAEEWASFVSGRVA